jgi:transposase IS481 family protein
MAHAHARLTEFGRLLLVQRITELGWPVAQAAESLGVSRATAYKWLGATALRARLGWPTGPRGPTVAPMRSRPPRCVGCWPPGGAAARVPIGSATTWDASLDRLWGAAPPWHEPAGQHGPGQRGGGAL